MGKVKHSQSYQNIKFVMPLQFLLKEVRDEVHFLDTDKHQRFLQVDFNIWHQSFYKVIGIIIKT